MSNYSEKLLDLIFSKGSIARGMNPKLYRRDCYGNPMFRRSYGKYTELGWNVDHSKPIAKGGTNSIRNLQPMNCFANCSKGTRY